MPTGKQTADRLQIALQNWPLVDPGEPWRTVETVTRCQGADHGADRLQGADGVKVPVLTDCQC